MYGYLHKTLLISIIFNFGKNLIFSKVIIVLSDTPSFLAICLKFSNQVLNYARHLVEQ